MCYVGKVRFRQNADGRQRGWPPPLRNAQSISALPTVCDLTLIQRQLLPAFIPTHRFTKAPRVLDVDDAIWLNRGGKRVVELAKSCELIICGNRFLADQFISWNDNVVVLPTPVDTDAIVPAKRRGAGRPVIGWTGTGENLRYVCPLERSLAAVLDRFPEARLMVVSDIAPKFTSIPSHRIEYVPWTPDSEIAALQRMTIGIMPLEDTLWVRGKCAFKMLCYMAAGVPVVVSPVGMNAEVLKLGELGIGATRADDWVESLSFLLAEPDFAVRMGTLGREIAVTNFSLRALAPRLAAELKKAAGLSGGPMLATGQSPCAV